MGMDKVIGLLVDGMSKFVGQALASKGKSVHVLARIATARDQN